MITLRIKKKGHFIEIPGMSPFRTPVEANISHVSIPLVVSALKSQGVAKFEIISDTVGKEQVLTQKDFIVKKKDIEEYEKEGYEDRFNKLEFLMKKLLQKQESETPLNKEQITNRLNSIEKLLKRKEPTRVIHVTKDQDESKKVEKEPKVEELEDTFIPNIDLEGFEMKGESSQESIKQDKLDIDDSADLLSRIIQSDG
jgi:hypothetical protein